MPFCFGSRIVSNQPLTDYLREAVQHFSVIELQADPRYFSQHFAFTENEKKALRIYQERFRFRLTMHAPFINLSLGSLSLEQRQLSISIFLNAMHTAADLGITLMTFHPSTIHPGTTDEQYKEICMFEEGSISILLKEAKKLGLILLIENMPLTPEYHPNTSDGSRFQELLWLFPEPEFGLTIDIGHALQAGVAIEALLKMERIRHFHFHENDRIKDRHLPIDNNMEWWQKLIKSLVKKFPDAVGILEMLSLKDQIISCNNLQKSIPKQSGAKHRRELMIPPIIS